MQTNPPPAPTSRPRLTVLRWSNALLVFTTTNLPAADSEPSRPPPPEWWHIFAWPFAAVAVAGLFVTAWLVQRWRASDHRLARRGPDGDLRFSREHITETFISALPTLTRELNLEVATSRQTETFERTESKSLLWGWLDLGTNVASLRVPVTYRYHLRFSDPWKLDVRGGTVLVRPPPLRASLPPAFHSDGLEVRTQRGWGRMPPDDLLTQLQRDLTPTLSQYAEDPRRLDHVREPARQAVAEFVRRWLALESRWKPGRFTAIQVQMADEKELPPLPTTRLIEPQPEQPTVPPA